MNIADLQAAVIAITGRPDRTAETLQAVQSATLKAHTREFYWRDLIEIPIDLGSAAMVWQVSYKLVSPYFRANKYLRKFDPATNTPGCFLTLVVPENILDAYALAKQDIYYYGGESLNINSSTMDQYYLYGFYNLPDITVSLYNSWIATDYPFAIVYQAAAEVFKAIGKVEEAGNYKELLPEQYAMLDASNITAQGS